MSTRLRGIGQDALAAHLETLPAAVRARLEAEIATVDLDLVGDLVRRLIRGEEHPVPDRIEPPDVIAMPSGQSDDVREALAREVGAEALAAGEVALVLVAGGQGTRLGFDGPKGDFPFGAVTGRTLFSHFAAYIEALRARYGAGLPWYIMTSTENDGPTRESFARADHFGLDPASIRFFTQGMLPAVDRYTGDILLAAPDRLALSPDGHGGLLLALRRHGLVEEMRVAGVRTIFTFQVDNPLVRIARPELIGHHRIAGAEMSSVVVRKVGPAERMGVVARSGERTVLVEYSNLPDELANHTTEAGALSFWAGSIAVHCIELDLVDRVTAGEERLPFHRAIKKVAHMTSDGTPVEPNEPNAVKFESFIFDALPFAEVTTTVEAARGEEFSPIKNAEGDDSPASCRRHLTERNARWLAAAGVGVEVGGDGAPVHEIEIDPRFALDAEELARKVTPGLGIVGPTALLPPTE